MEAARRGAGREGPCRDADAEQAAAGSQPEEPPEWASSEANLDRQLKTLEVAYALRTISKERYEDERRRLESRRGATEG